MSSSLLLAALALAGPMRTESIPVLRLRPPDELVAKEVTTLALLPAGAGLDASCNVVVDEGTPSPVDTAIHLAIPQLFTWTTPVVPEGSVAFAPPEAAHNAFRIVEPATVEVQAAGAGLALTPGARVPASKLVPALGVDAILAIRGSGNDRTDAVEVSVSGTLCAGRKLLWTHREREEEPIGVAITVNGKPVPAAVNAAYQRALDRAFPRLAKKVQALWDPLDVAWPVDRCTKSALTRLKAGEAEEAWRAHDEAVEASGGKCDATASRTFAALELAVQGDLEGAARDLSAAFEASQDPAVQAARVQVATLQAERKALEAYWSRTTVAATSVVKALKPAELCAQAGGSRFVLVRSGSGSGATAVEAALAGCPGRVPVAEVDGALQAFQVPHGQLVQPAAAATVGAFVDAKRVWVVGESGPTGAVRVTEQRLAGAGKPAETIEHQVEP